MSGPLTAARFYRQTFLPDITMTLQRALVLATCMALLLPACSREQASTAVASTRAPGHGDCRSFR